MQQCNKMEAVSIRLSRLFKMPIIAEPNWDGFEMRPQQRLVIFQEWGNTYFMIPSHTCDGLSAAGIVSEVLRGLARAAAV